MIDEKELKLRSSERHPTERTPLRSHLSVLPQLLRLVGRPGCNGQMSVANRLIPRANSEPRSDGGLTLVCWLMGIETRGGGE
jgi:hypothetical protein